MTLLSVYSATSTQVALGIIRKRILDNMDMKLVMSIIPWTLIGCLHSCSCLSFIQIFVTKVYREITTFLYIPFDHSILLQREKLSFSKMISCGKPPHLPLQDGAQPEGRVASFEINNLSAHAHMPVLLTHADSKYAN